MSDETMRDKRLHAYAVLSHMGFSTDFDATPDNLDEWSPGARYCLRVYDDAREAWENGEFDRESDRNDYDTAYDRAAVLRPIRSDNIWRIWADLTLYNWDELDEEPYARGANEDLTLWAARIAEMLAADAMVSLVREWREELDDDADDDADDDDDSDA